MTAQFTGWAHPRFVFRSLRYRNYRLYFVSQAISQTGTWMQITAQQWLIYHLTGSAAMLGVVNLLSMVPIVPLTLVSGALADRFPKRLLILAAQIIMMFSALVLAGLSWLGAVQLWQVVLFAMISAGANVVDLPARQALVIELIDNKADLSNAIGLNSVVYFLAMTAGPVAAGLIIAMTGAAWAFFLNGISFIAVIAALLLMRLPARPPVERVPRLRFYLWEALEYLGRQPTILVIISLTAISSFFLAPFISLLPAFASQVFGGAVPLTQRMCGGPSAVFTCQSPEALAYGLLMAARGLGAIIGAICVAMFSGEARQGLWMTLTNLAAALLLVGVALSHSFPLTCLLLLGVGGCFVIRDSMANTLIQLSVEDRLRGRVMSFYSFSALGLIRLGGLQAGIVADIYSIPIAIGISAVVGLAFGLLVIWRFPRLSRLSASQLIE
jgi:MFS family permease